MNPRKGRIRTFKVKMHVPPDVSLDDAMFYILDAVSTWKGSLKPITALDPDDPNDDYDHMTEMREETVEVSLWKRRRK